MNVYQIMHDVERFEWLAVTEANQWGPVMAQAQDEPFGTSWRPLVLSSISSDDEDYSGLLSKGDFVGIGAGEFALRRTATEQIGDLLRTCGELLQLQWLGGPERLVWFHCTTVIDALDEGKTIAKRFADGRMYGFDRLWFFKDRLRDALLFKIPQSKGPLLCTGLFKDHVETLGLTGLTFTLKWSDEPAGLKKVADWEQVTYKGSLPPLPVR